MMGLVRRRSASREVRTTPTLYVAKCLPVILHALTLDQGDEYLHLPAIVDAAESSPVAAKEAANCIRRFLSKDRSNRAYTQYNAIMLTRILTDNPAKTFTRNFDTKFVTAVKELVRDGQDMSVQQILRETLDYFEAEKLADNDSLLPLVEWWRKEKTKMNARLYGHVAVRPLSPSVLLLLTMLSRPDHDDLTHLP